jgi:hypothetical protein
VSAAPQPADARLDLSARAAAAGDRTFVARYGLTAPGRAPRIVTVTRAADGSWRVDIPLGALGGTADISVARIGSGVFTCSLPTATRPQPSTCARVAEKAHAVPDRYDPQVQHPFTDWAEALTDQQSPLAVSVSNPLPGVQGTCYAVESTSTSISIPLDAGIYCYDPDGLLTGARVSFGTLVLAGPAAPAPPSVNLPGPVTGGEPLTMAPAPPSPTPSPAASATRPPAAPRPTPTGR